MLVAKKIKSWERPKKSNRQPTEARHSYGVLYFAENGEDIKISRKTYKNLHTHAKWLFFGNGTKDEFESKITGIINRIKRRQPVFVQNQTIDLFLVFNYNTDSISEDLAGFIKLASEIDIPVRQVNLNVCLISPKKWDETDLRRLNEVTSSDGEEKVIVTNVLLFNKYNVGWPKGGTVYHCNNSEIANWVINICNNLFGGRVLLHNRLSYFKNIETNGNLYTATTNSHFFERITEENTDVDELKKVIQDLENEDLNYLAGFLLAFGHKEINRLCSANLGYEEVLNHCKSEEATIEKLRLKGFLTYSAKLLLLELAFVVMKMRLKKKAGADAGTENILTQLTINRNIQKTFCNRSSENNFNDLAAYRWLQLNDKGEIDAIFFNVSQNMYLKNAFKNFFPKVTSREYKSLLGAAFEKELSVIYKVIVANLLNEKLLKPLTEIDMGEFEDFKVSIPLYELEDCIELGGVKDFIGFVLEKTFKSLNRMEAEINASCLKEVVGKLQNIFSDLQTYYEYKFTKGVVGRESDLNVNGMLAPFIDVEGLSIFKYKKIYANKRAFPNIELYQVKL